uniref:Uncharacterized protein n=1 Tax=Pycnococcus provasolii TaxID=41880 RepID=A0A7S2YXK2_9CHLO
MVSSSACPRFRLRPLRASSGSGSAPQGNSWGTGRGGEDPSPREVRELAAAMVDTDTEDLLDSLGPPSRVYTHVDGAELKVRVGTGMSAREMRAVGRAKHWMHQDARWRMRYIAGFFRSHQRDNFIDQKLQKKSGEPSPFSSRHIVPGLAQYDCRVAGQRSLFRERYFLMQQMAAMGEEYETKENEDVHDIPNECADPRTSPIMRATWDAFAFARDENIAHRMRAEYAAEDGGAIVSELDHVTNPQIPMSGERLELRVQTESAADDLHSLLLDPDQETAPRPARFVSEHIDIVPWGEDGADPSQLEAEAVDGISEVIPRSLMDFTAASDREMLATGTGSLSPSYGFKSPGKAKPASCFTQYGHRVYAKNDLPTVKPATDEDFTDRWSEFWLPLMLETDAEGMREFTRRERKPVEGTDGEYVYGDSEDEFVSRMGYEEARRRRRGRPDACEPGEFRQIMHNNAPPGSFPDGVSDRL